LLPGAINQQVERFQNNLSEQWLATRRTDDAIGIEFPIAHANGDDTRNRSLLLALVSISDDCLPLQPQSQRLNQILRQEHQDGTRVNKHATLLETDLCDGELSFDCQLAVERILKFDLDSNFAHGGAPLSSWLTGDNVKHESS
jgi:hypothetical protein